MTNDYNLWDLWRNLLFIEVEGGVYIEEMAMDSSGDDEKHDVMYICLTVSFKNKAWIWYFMSFSYRFLAPVKNCHVSPFLDARKICKINHYNYQVFLNKIISCFIFAFKFLFYLNNLYLVLNFIETIFHLSIIHIFCITSPWKNNRLLL